MARSALGLLLPGRELYAIAIEGLSQEDESALPAAAIEVADATFYYGPGSTFQTCQRMEVAQFKYSVASSAAPFRAADLKKTLEKFAATEHFLAKKHGPDSVRSKATYSLYTNRPISTGLIEAFRAASTGQPAGSKDAGRQLAQLRQIAALDEPSFRTLIARTALVGQLDALIPLEQGNARTLVDWSASTDALASARLGQLRQLVREKAGSEGEGNNLIRQVDILGALGIANESDLLPTPAAFPAVGSIVERAQLTAFAQAVAQFPRWIVHASAGTGKTVFAQSLAAALRNQHEVVLFDCFGGGSYRISVDARHRPERGLLHIVNDLACRGLCDPILPGTTDPAEVVRRSIDRFRQAINTIRRTRANAHLFIIIDAADNAAWEADRRNQPAFPRELLETLTVRDETAPGLCVVATARTERQNQAIGAADCRPFEVARFTLAETEQYVAVRRPDATLTQIHVVHQRANGNPRVITNLIEPGRDLVGDTSIATPVALDSLIQDRIERAVAVANRRGAGADSIEAFLCALSALPPPVPFDVIATAFGISAAEVESFAVDLSPLLARTRHGLIFRDEPTETLVARTYGTRLQLLDDVVKRLSVAQSDSVYAARALPVLLLAMRRVAELRALALSAEFPESLTGDIAKRSIRLSRLRTAVAAAAQVRDFDGMVDLLVELSAVVAVDERGQDYLLAHPDLVVTLGDAESLRRLFESRSKWPGLRHARLATAFAVDGDLAEAYVHGRRAEEWTAWLLDRQRQDEYVGVHPEIEDRVFVAPFLVARERLTRLALYLAHWERASYCYRLTVRACQVCQVSRLAGKMPNLKGVVDKAARNRRLPAPIAAALLTAFPDLDATAVEALVRHLPNAIAKTSHREADWPEYGEVDSYQLALQRCAIRAAHLRLQPEGSVLAHAVTPKRFDLWSLRGPFSTRDVVPAVLSIAARAAVAGHPPTLFDCLPAELWNLVAVDPTSGSDTQQRTLLEQRLAETAKPREGNTPPALSESDRSRARGCLDVEVPAILALTTRLTALIRASTSDQRTEAISTLFDSWTAALAHAQKNYLYQTEAVHFVDAVFREAVIHALIALNAFTPQTAAAVVQWMERASFVPIVLSTELVQCFAGSTDTDRHAGLIATKTLQAIGREDDVQRRSTWMARLARALLPADRAEAKLLFARGLSELDAIGSGDFSFTNDLLWFASRTSGDPLPSETAHRLAKVCELNVYDSRKFPWPLASAAFSRVWGLPYLAQIARWHDRDKADLTLTLPSALSCLVRDRRIPPEHAIALLRLVEPEEGWDWGWDHFVESLIAVNPTSLPDLLRELLSQYELAHPRRPRPTTIRRIAELIAASPAAESLQDPLERLRNRSKVPPESSHSGRERDSQANQDTESIREREAARHRRLEDAVAQADPLDAASLEALVEALNAIDRAVTVKAEAFGRLRSRVAYADRIAHVRAVAATRNLELFAQNRLFADIKSEWLASSPSQLGILKEVSGGLVRSHAATLVSKDSGSLYELRELAEITSQPVEDFAVAVVDAAASAELDASASAWLNLASILCEKATSEVPRSATERLLNSGAARLTDEIGDGPWTSALATDRDPSAVAAGLIWFRLGSPAIEDRWRAAHAVRTLGRFGQWRVIDELFARYETSTAGAFQDPRLPFFPMHSQQWFLLAIARVALDYPADIGRHRSQLEGIALNNAFPHVAIREAARQALYACIANDDSEETLRLKTRLQQVHVSTLRRQKRPVRPYGGSSWDRPSEVPKPDPAFHFDYDFDKHEISGVARLFGLPTWQVADACVRWIRQWDSKIESMNDFGGRERPSGHSDYSMGTEERLQSYGAYLARHALVIEAGHLLLTTPLITSMSSYDDWDTWVARHRPTRRDGLWLADGLGQFPDFTLHDLLEPKVTNSPTPSDDPALLGSLVGIGENTALGDWITIEAAWSSPDHVSVGVYSGLVPPTHSELAARAVLTAAPMDMWLPHFEYDEDDDATRRPERDMAPVEAWVTDTPVDTRLDQSDPYASQEALKRPRPSKNIRRAFRLRPDKPWATQWMAPNNRVVFESLAWGRHVGEGERDATDAGSALRIERHFLSKALTALDRDLLLLVKLQHYRDRSRSESPNQDPGSNFSHGVMLVIIDRSLRCRRMKASEADLRSIAELNQYDCFDFKKRLRVLTKA